MSARDRAALTAGAAVLLALTAFGPVFDSTGWVLRTAGAVVVPLAVLALARRLRLPGTLAPLLGLLVLAGYLVAVFVPASLSSGVLPARGTLSALRALLEAAGQDLDQYGPPAPATAALVLLLAAGAGLVALSVDALAGALHRPAAAGVPLLALFAVPSALLPGGLGWLPFVLGASGWLALLLAESRDQVGRWGTALRRSEDRADPTGLTRVGRRIGGAALAVAVLVPALLPGLQTRLLDGGSGGSGGGGGSRSVVTYNPITRLRGELTLPVPVDVLSYRTDDPQPDYLRMTTLGVYDGGGWRQEVLRGNLRDDGVDDPVPLPVGRTSATPVRDVTASVRVAALDAFWLPVPATPTRVDVKGPWMWDPATQSVFATRSNTSEVGPYQVRSARVLPDPSLLAVGDGPLPAEIAPYAAPVEATGAVRALTARTVRGATTSYAKAAAVQAFFRNPANRFVYSEQTDEGGSPDALESFLSRRRGFCEQYASAMAAMLRLAGVPSRVAVGFTPGHPAGRRQLPRDHRRGARVAGGLVRRRRLGPVRAHPLARRDQRSDVRDAGRPGTGPSRGQRGARGPAGRRRGAGRDGGRAQGAARRRGRLAAGRPPGRRARSGGCRVGAAAGTAARGAAGPRAPRVARRGARAAAPGPAARDGRRARLAAGLRGRLGLRLRRGRERQPPPGGRGARAGGVAGRAGRGGARPGDERRRARPLRPTRTVRGRGGQPRRRHRRGPPGAAAGQRAQHPPAGRAAASVDGALGDERQQPGAGRPARCRGPWAHGAVHPGAGTAAPPLGLIADRSATAGGRPGGQPDPRPCPLRGRRVS